MYGASSREKEEDECNKLNFNDKLRVKFVLQERREVVSMWTEQSNRNEDKAKISLAQLEINLDRIKG